MATKQQSTPSEISFNLVNNTTSDILMSFLSNPSNLQDISNQYTEYSWDITSIANNLGAYTQLILTLSNGTTLQAPILTPTLNGIVIALNTFQISSFYYDVSGGSTFIKTYNDIQAFTTLEILSSSGTSLQLFYQIFTNFSTTGDCQIDNGGTFNTGLLANPQNIPSTNASGLILLNDNINVNLTLPVQGVDINTALLLVIDEIVGLTTTNLFNFVVTGLTASTSFPLSNPNATYNINVGYPTYSANYNVVTTSTDGSVIIDYGQGLLPIWLNPTFQTFDYTNNVSIGQLVQVSGFAPNTGSVLTVRVKISSQNLSTGATTIISNNLYSSGASFTDSFTIASGNAYQILVTDT
jgi:hypothetical protein